MKRRSVRVRLAAINALMLITTLAVATLATWLLIRDSIDDTLDEALRLRWYALRGGVTNAIGANRTATLTEDLDLAADTALRLSEAGKFLYVSPAARDWGPTPTVNSDVLDDVDGRTVTVDGHPVRIIALPVAVGDPTRIVELGTRCDEFYEILDEFLYTALAATPLLLLVAAGGGYWMSRRALAPVDRITQTARAIDAQNLAERLPLRGVDDELERLSITLNGMFGRLEDSFRRVTQFTADASHELRTPVAIIHTAAEVCRRRARTEAEYQATLDRILEESERTSRIIDNLLLLARADAGEEILTTERVDLAAVVRDVSAQSCVLSDALNVTLNVSAPAPCWVAGDAERIRAMFLVLIDNAMKYSPAGAVVNVSLTADAAAAVVEVQDCGIGIPAAAMPRIFERFYRVSMDRARTSGGTGLGLSIAQLIATAHGGGIEVRSELGHGSTFRVRLPVADVFSESSERLRHDVVEEGIE